MTSVKVTFRGTALPAGTGPPGPPLPALLPHDTRRTSPSAALNAERQAVGEHLRKATIANASLCFIYSVRRTIEGHGSRLGIDDRIRGPRVSVARLTDAAGIDERAIVQLVNLVRRRLDQPHTGRKFAEQRRNVRV